MNRTYITSGEFAKLCDTTKETLRHYKDIGLLIPKYEGKNGYQYYDAEQFYDYYAISIFKKTGTSLTKIKECIGNQDIPAVLKALEAQQEALEKEKRKIEQMQFVVKNSIVNMRMGLAHNIAAHIPQIAFFKKEHLFAIPHNEFIISEKDKDDENRILISVLRRYKEICNKYNVQTDYQLGALMELGSKNITHIYTRVDKAYKNSYYKEKPAGNYLYIIHKGNWNLDISYKILFNYIGQNNIKAVGNIYSYDLAGFMVNGIENNFMTIISIQVIV